MPLALVAGVSRRTLCIGLVQIDLGYKERMWHLSITCRVLHRRGCRYDKLT